MAIPNRSSLSRPGALELNVISRKDYWRGFEDPLYYTKKFSLQQVPNMMRYPTLRGLIRIIYMTILSMDFNIIANDERTYNILEYYHRHSYRRIATMLMWKAMQWGWAVGEKVLRPVEIDGKTYLLPKGVIVPTPTSTKFVYGDSMDIDGFSYENAYTEKERTALYIFQGDEICLPRGNSVCEDVHWAWRQLMEDWSRFNIYKDFKAVPPFKLKYPEDLTTDSEGNVVDKNADVAEQKLKDMRTVTGITLPRKWNKDTGEFIELWDIEELAVAEKVTAHLESINKNEALMFLGGLTPKRITEQDLKVGSYSMLKEQAEFFYLIEEMRAKEWNEYHHRWIVDPLLQLNTGKVEGYVELSWGDELKKYFLDLVLKGAMVGYANIDWKDVQKRAGIPWGEEEGAKKETATTEEEDERHKKKVSLFFDSKTSYARARLSKEDRAEIQRREKKWVDQINGKLIPLRDVAYDEIVKELKQIQGKMGLNIAREMNREFPLKMDKAAALVQIPRKAFSSFRDHLITAYYIGAKPVFNEIKIPVPDKPTREAIGKMKWLDQKFTGIGGKNIIPGQPEVLEGRLFYAVTYAKDTKTAFDEFNRAFRNYIEVTLPDNVMNELNISVNIGIMDAAQQLKMITLQAQKEGKKK